MCFGTVRLLMNKHKHGCAKCKWSIIMRITPPCTIKKPKECERAVYDETKQSKSQVKFVMFSVLFCIVPRPRYNLMTYVEEVTLPRLGSGYSNVCAGQWYALRQLFWWSIKRDNLIMFILNWIYWSVLSLMRVIYLAAAMIEMNIYRWHDATANQKCRYYITSLFIRFMTSYHTCNLESKEKPQNCAVS